MSAPMASRPPVTLQQDLVRALRGSPPVADAAPAALDACLARYQCGGYLHGLYRDRPGLLPPAWAGAAARSHRKTLVDSLAALAALKEIEALLRREGVSFVLLKGAAYLVDLYPDPGTRALTDVDLLVRPEDARRVARRLAESGLSGEVGRDYPEDCRFEMFRAGPAACRFEIHWRLGVEGRMRIDQASIWAAARPVLLEGVAARILPAEEALLYHVGHAADHYYGPGIKWVIDLREMLRRWHPDVARLGRLARDWRVMTALHLALRQLEGLFPGEAPPALLRATAPGPLRAALLRRFRSREPAEFFVLGPTDRGRVMLRPLLLDSPADALSVGWKVLMRPATGGRHGPGAGFPPPWAAIPPGSGTSSARPSDAPTAD